MFNVRPDERWPWLWIEPPTEDVPGFRVTPPEAEDPPGLHLWSPPMNDPPGFHVAADGSVPSDVRPSDVGLAFPGIIGNGSGPFGFLDRRVSSLDPHAPPDSGLLSLPAVPPMFPEISGRQHSWSNLEGNAGQPSMGSNTPVPGFRVKPADSVPGFRVGVDGAVRDTLSDAFGIASFGHSPRSGGWPSGTTVGSTSPWAEHGTYSSIDLDHPSDLAVPQRDRTQEAFDQLARIYAGVGGDRFFHRQPSHTDSTVTVGDGFGGWPSPTSEGQVDPRHIVPVNRPTGPPPRGIGDNSRQVPKQGPASSPQPQPQPQAPRGAPSTQPPPDTAGPAAAAEAAAQERAATYNTYREQLQALGPDNPLLKLEPVPGVVPDRATVDRYGEEVRGVVRKRVDRTIENLSARSTYDNSSAVRTIVGDVDLRAEFERLKAGGKPIQGGVPVNTAEAMANSTNCREGCASGSEWPMIRGPAKSARYRPWT
ncbi:MAG: hypothetical protein HYX38_35635 [Rhodospirillales bacterium]|nr:hypothetical protein [Rhodospirillales bacterium]